MTTIHLLEAMRDLDKDLARGVITRIEYRAKREALEAAWTAWLYTEYADDFTPAQQGMLFARAWDEGHANGYQEVAHHLDALAIWAREFIS